MKHRIIYVLIITVFLVGLCLFLYPYMSRWSSEKQSKQVISDFKNMIEDENDKVTGGKQNTDEYTDKNTDKGGISDENGISDKNGSSDKEDDNKLIYSDLYQDFKEYNKQIYEEGQKELKDPFSYETTAFDLSGYGFRENVIGILWIPRLNLELPIYLGANDNTMSKGIGLLGQTSMPTGGDNTNMVLAGHRGWHGIPMFRDIQSVQADDKIQITTPWETLIYRVCELKIIPKDNTEDIYIQKGRDLVTLLTCHPYTVNTRRYVVIAERSDELPKDHEKDVEEARETKSEEPQEVEVITENGNTIELVNTKKISAVLYEGLRESGTEYSVWRIIIETYVPIMGIGLVIIVAFILWCITKRTKKTGA